jgi:serine/threonine protein kinase
MGMTEPQSSGRMPPPGQHIDKDQSSRQRDEAAQADDAREAATVAADAPPTPAPDTQPDAAGGATPDSAWAHSFLAPPQAPDELGRLGPYRVLKVLGTGGMGIVFLAQDIRLGRQVALKAMLPQLASRPEARERFLREARTAAAIEHENIVAIFQVDEDRGVPYIAMPLLRGTTLESWLRAHKDEMLPLPLILKLGRQIAHGLAAAHAVGLIHRDIKPANLFLQSAAGDSSGRLALLPTSPLMADFRVKILDFGLARSSRGTQELTQSGVILGTPAYMAPEQARRGARVDHRADLFSLGVVLYRLCTGRLPFQGDDMMSTLMALATEEPTPPLEINPALPSSLSGLVMRLLQKDADSRPASAEDVAERLAAVETWLADAVLRPGAFEEPSSASAPRPPSAEQSAEPPGAAAAQRHVRELGPQEREARPARRDAPDQPDHPSHWDRDDVLNIRRPPSAAMSIAAMILGLSGLLIAISATVMGVTLPWCCLVGGFAGLSISGILSGLAIIFGLIGLKQAGRKYALTGLISAGITLVLILAYIVVVVVWGVNFFGQQQRNAPVFRPPMKFVPPAPVKPPAPAAGPLVFEKKDRLTQKDPKNQEQKPARTYKVQLEAGKTYVIDMKRNKGAGGDPYLILLDPQGKEVARDDDGGGNLDAQIRYSPAATGEYTIQATVLAAISIPNNGMPFTLTVRQE